MPRPRLTPSKPFASGRGWSPRVRRPTGAGRGRARRWPGGRTSRRRRRRGVPGSASAVFRGAAISGGRGTRASMCSQPVVRGCRWSCRQPGWAGGAKEPPARGAARVHGRTLDGDGGHRVDHQLVRAILASRLACCRGQWPFPWALILQAVRSASPCIRCAAAAVCHTASCALPRPTLGRLGRVGAPRQHRADLDAAGPLAVVVIVGLRPGVDRPPPARPRRARPRAAAPPRPGPAGGSSRTSFIVPFLGSWGLRTVV